MSITLRTGHPRHRIVGFTTAITLAAVLGTTGTAAAQTNTGGDGGSGQITIQVTVSGSMVSCVDGAGAALPANPTLHVGDKVTCSINGFGANEPVAVTLDKASAGKATADGNGSAKFPFTVPDGTTDGPHTLLFTGQTSKTTGAFPFVVAAAIAGENAGGVGGGGAGGPLAFTGVEVAELIAVGFALLAGGTAVTVGARRRRTG